MLEVNLVGIKFLLWRQGCGFMEISVGSALLLILYAPNIRIVTHLNCGRLRFKQWYWGGGRFVFSTKLDVWKGS